MNCYKIFKIAAAILCSLILSLSCESEIEKIMGVSVKTPLVTGESGQMFVKVECEGDWNLSLTCNTGAVDWAELNVTSGKGDMNNIILSYGDNVSNGSRSLMVVLSSGSETVSCKVTQKPSDRQDNPSEDSGDDMSASLSKTGWMELPAMNDSSLGYYSHSFSMGGKTYRNYSFAWSQKDLVSVWVAYPLSKLYTNGNVGRTDEWAYDEILGQDSSFPGPGYGGDYVRGHQLPSGDRQCARKANEQTFFGTNITPQLNAHNGGIWLELENKVRTMAEKADTMYVVTGCMVKNSTITTHDTYNKKMTVPTAYFKALLRYSKSSTLTQWSMAGFYLEHRSYKESLSKAHSMSIDELEKLTGLDFFVNLPAKIGADQAAALEAADPSESNVWW